MLCCITCIVRIDSWKKNNCLLQVSVYINKGNTPVTKKDALLYFTIKWRYKGDEEVSLTLVVIQVGIYFCLPIDIKIAVCK